MLEKLIPQLTARGLKVSVIKHAHHGFDIDRPGKDSYRHREAGATEVLLSCGDRWALMHERRDEVEPTLNELIGHLSPCDLVLIEGFKQEPVPKLEVYRPENGKPPLFPRAQATSSPWPPMPTLPPTLPKLPLNDYAAMADFVMNHLNLQARPC